MKKLVFAGLLALLATAVPAVSQANPVTLNVDYPFPGDFKPMQEAIADAFMQQHPDIKINFSQPATNYDELFQQTLRNAVTGGQADVSFQSYNYVQPLADRQIPVPLDDFIAGEKDWAGLGYLPSTSDMAKANGKVVGLPFNTSIPVIYYNLDLVKAAGGDPDHLPTDWAGIAKLAKAIKDSAPSRDGIYFDYYYIVANLTFAALIESAGGQMMTPDLKQIAFNGPEGMAALNTLHDIGASGMVDQTRDQALQSFRAGNMGIFVSTTSYLNSFEKAGFGLATAAFPLTLDKGRYPAGGNAAMIFTKDPVKQKAAWEYLKFVTGPEAQLLVVKYQGYIPNNQKVLQNPEFRDTYYSDARYRVGVDQLANVVGPFTFPGENAQKIANIIRDHLRDIVTLEHTPAEVMPEMVKDVQALLPGQ